MHIITIVTNITITIIKMVETVEELMIAVLGGSAEIVGWPKKVVLCAAEVRSQPYLAVRYNIEKGLRALQM